MTTRKFQKLSVAYKWYSNIQKVLSFLAPAYQDSSMHSGSLRLKVFSVLLGKWFYPTKGYHIDRLPTPLSLKTYHYQTLVSVSSSRFSTQQRKGFKFRFWTCVTLSNNQSPCKSKFILKNIYPFSSIFILSVCFTTWLIYYFNILHWQIFQFFPFSFVLLHHLHTI